MLHIKINLGGGGGGERRWTSWTRASRRGARELSQRVSRGEEVGRGSIKWRRRRYRRRLGELGFGGERLGRREWLGGGRRGGRRGGGRGGTTTWWDEFLFEMGSERARTNACCCWQDLRVKCGFGGVEVDEAAKRTGFEVKISRRKSSRILGFDGKLIFEIVLTPDPLLRHIRAAQGCGVYSDRFESCYSALY